MVSIGCETPTGTILFEGIRAVIFDKDATLADVEPYLRALAVGRSHLLNQHYPGIEAPLLRAFGLVGDRLNPAGLMMVGTRHENAIAAATYLAEQGVPWFTALAEVTHHFTAADAQLPPKATQTPLFPGIRPLLERLATQGCLLGIISSDTSPNIQAFLDTHTLTPLFQGHLGADPGAPTKPNPVLVHRLCEAWSVAPREVLVVGDAQGDIDMAIAAQVAGAIGAIWAWPSQPPTLPTPILLDSPTKISVFA